MKIKKWLCAALLFLFCMQSASCAAPEVTEGSSDPSEESSEPAPAPEDPNAAVVRAYFEELLEEEWSAEWLTEERAETIRESVKQLKTPILTEEDVLSLAGRAARVYFTAWKEKQAIRLPACGVLDTVYSDTGAYVSYLDHEYAYNALFAYTVYLFTPPDYVFWGKEVWNEEWYPSVSAGVDPSYALCLPFAPAAGEYANRPGALADMREKQSCIRLYPLHISGGERPLGFSYCGKADLLKGDRLTIFDLLEFARRGSVDLSEEFEVLYAESYALEWINRILYDGWRGIDVDYVLPNGDTVIVYQPLSAEEVQEIRETVELLPAPFLTEEMMWELQVSMRESAILSPLVLLPGFDGTEDLLLPPGIDRFEATSWVSEKEVAVKANGATAYLLDLFTPSAFRFTDLLGPEGTYYRLNSEAEGYMLISEAYMRGESGLYSLYAAGEEAEAIE